jgi:molybdate transport system substrate-binding protein
MADKLKVLCARSMTAAGNAIADEFTRATGTETDITFGTVGALQTRLANGERADVLVLGSPAVAKLEQEGRVVAGSRTDIAKTSIGVCARQGAPAPDIATPEAFVAALRAARAIAVSDPAVGGTAGTYLVGLWERLGVAAELAGKLAPQKSGVEVASRVVEGAADLGLTLIGEIAAVKGARVIGKLPPPYGQDTVYAAAVMTGGDEQRGRAFIAALAQPESAPVWRAAGFEPARRGA